MRRLVIYTHKSPPRLSNSKSNAMVCIHRHSCICDRQTVIEDWKQALDRTNNTSGTGVMNVYRIKAASIGRECQRGPRDQRQKRVLIRVKIYYEQVNKWHIFIYSFICILAKTSVKKLYHLLSVALLSRVLPDLQQCLKTIYRDGRKR